MFRVSPWIQYDPNGETQQDHSRSDHRFRNMNEDVDMDAPQISTLKEEETPEPQPSPGRQTKFRVKLVMNDNKLRAAPPAGPSGRKEEPKLESEDEEDEDEEEDQLIDDDEEEPRAGAPAAVVPAPVPTEKRGAGAKRGTTTGRGRGRGRGARAKAGIARTDTSPIIVSGVTTSTDGLGTITIPANTSLSAPGVSPPRKRGGAPKAAGQRAPRKRAPKTSKAIPPHMRDDVNVFSDVYVGTGASTPPHDEPSPHFDDLPLPSHTIPIGPIPADEDINLEGVPLPLYPLPTKPFPVLPAPKIPTGLAPVMPLDKSGKKIRKWRQAQREIRGIAGGRWFAKTWIGDKESEYAAAHAVQPPPIPAATQATALAMIGGGELLPGMGTLPIPRLSGATSGRGRGRGGFATPSSRAQSAGADSVSAPKKRTTQSSSLADTPSGPDSVL
ncbi:uncharacterized protein PHACADRAFT_248039 [Phanerochaete carnosa HHB-10118-sp]|uniref:Uncharacterized protein n=1 Tax=Phanerochaete carnosa (strain HHB-10118-sp) TaxID=650164 RepID=K5WQC9_PHACS|nr:uncharacterized protein PHACADRAFT_248039 [Phanerochaete carnosa HHB-10118-sp]EKM61434.1 hypothetical protein PHACADRAFT_248039 [Phanerochaete carnosa HHB-10118-sp]